MKVVISVFFVLIISTLVQSAYAEGGYAFHCRRGIQQVDPPTKAQQEGPAFDVSTEGNVPTPLGEFWGMVFKIKYDVQNDVAMVILDTPSATTSSVAATAKSSVPVMLSLIQNNIQKSIVCAKYQ